MIPTRRAAIPRLSLYRPDRGNDYYFIDRLVLEQFTVGGTDLFIHKYLGPKNPIEENASPIEPIYDIISETNIQDLLFLENRDRKYDPNVYHLRGVYNVQDNDFNLTQFGLFFDSDILYVTIHINGSVKTLGRKIMSGDVVELPHLKDEYALNDYSVALKRFYVVEEVSRAAEGFSVTWYPHLYRIKLKQITDSQEFKDIFNLPADEENPDHNSLRDVLSMNNRDLEINDRIIRQGEIDSLKSGRNVQYYYHLIPAEYGFELDIGNPILGETPDRLGYSGYFLGDDFAPNGSPFIRDVSFPLTAQVGDYCLRVDYKPNRMFRYDGNTWVKMYDAIRETLNNSETKQTHKWEFINNDNKTFQDKVASDSVILNIGDYVINTSITYPIEAKYVQLKSDAYNRYFNIQENPDLLIQTSEGTVCIVLPEVNGIQDTINYQGQWDIYFYNHSEPERQSLSTALRPKADY